MGACSSAIRRSSSRPAPAPCCRSSCTAGLDARVAARSSAGRAASPSTCSASRSRARARSSPSCSASNRETASAPFEQRRAHQERLVALRIVRHLLQFLEATRTLRRFLLLQPLLVRDRLLLHVFDV